MVPSRRRDGGAVIWDPDCQGPCDCPGEKEPRAKVILFRKGGKYYTEETWRRPTAMQVAAGGGTPGDTVGPYSMRFSPDFRRIDGGPVLVETQEPWGYPHLIPADGLNPACSNHNLVQHRDLQRPWCNVCGLAADGEKIGDVRAFGSR